MSRTVKMPETMEPVEYRAPRVVDLPDSGGIPLVGGPRDPEDKQVQHRYMARVSVFDLSKEDQRVAYEAVWQTAYDQAGGIVESRIDFDAANARYMAVVRWYSNAYLPPRST
jgi:hypothetical protein